MLEVRSVTASYGAVVALDEASIQVPEGASVAILGPNGAGKSTLLRVISGLVRPSAGSISFAGADLAGTSVRERVKRGIVHVPEGRELFPGLTVRENLAMGAVLRGKADVAIGSERVEAYFPWLAERREHKAGTLSGGEQQMLAIARGLMAQPSLLLLDEPSVGLAPTVVDQIRHILRELRLREGITTLIVEQNVGLALSVADYGYVLAAGSVQVQGPSRDLRENEVVTNAYPARSNDTGGDPTCVLPHARNS